MNTKMMLNLPIFFKKNRVFRVYTGGKLFSDFFGDDSEDSFYPEEWICSSVKALNKDSADPFEGLSVVEDTDWRFDELLKTEKARMLGERDGLDVLVKALDSAIRLPVQAHPDKAFSQKFFSSDFGKAESWYVLATREDAAIYFGFKEGVTKQDFDDAIIQSATDKSAMERLLNRIPVSAGDVYFIPAKAVHAIGAGCLILEVQEPTDFTIQPEEWCGDYHLSEKEMYLGLDKDDALGCFDFSFDLKRVLNECKKKPSVIEYGHGFSHEALVTKRDTPCFSVERYRLNGGKTPPFPAPAVYVVTDGSGRLKTTGGDYKRNIKQGDYFFVPFAAADRFYAESGEKLEIAVCLPPEK